MATVVGVGWSLEDDVFPEIASSNTRVQHRVYLLLAERALARASTAAQAKNSCGVGAFAVVVSVGDVRVRLSHASASEDVT